MWVSKLFKKLYKSANNKNEGLIKKGQENK